MKIAIATPVLFNPTSPFNHLFKDILGGFLESGYDIIRFVAVRKDEDDSFKFGYEKIEYKKYLRKDSSHNNIISRYIRDSFTNIREARGIKKTDADVLFEDVSYSSFWAIRAAKKKNMRVVAMLQDVWPDNAVQSGLIKQGGLLYKFFEFWQRYVYKKADKLICISDDMKDFIVSKGIEEQKIKVIYNWGYSDDTVSIPWEDNEFVKKYNIKKDFYVVYAGNIGKMQNVELVVKAAKKLTNTNFLIIGDGAKRDEIEKMVEGAENIRMFPLQPPKLAEHIYSMAGVNIIPLVEGGPKTAMPSKTGVVLSCGRPVIFCFGSGTRFADIVEKNCAGTSVSATDEDDLVEAIKCHRNKEGDRTGAYQLFGQLFSRTNNIKSYAESVKFLGIMRVLFINTVFGRGSTGRIVADLGKMLEANGHEFKVAYGRGDSNPDAHCYRIGNKLGVYIHAGLSRFTDRAGFYSKKATKKLVEFIREYNPDLIHLHNLHGYYLNIEILFSFLADEFKGRVIWTLHDCWAFTGHCVHFTNIGCDKWKTGCNHCPEKKEYPVSILCDRSEKNYSDKKKLFTALKNLEIVTVSEWLKNTVESSFLKDTKVRCIYNGVDTKRFRPVQNKVKEELGISGKKMILLVSDGWTEKKGFSTVCEVAKAAPSDWKFVIVGLTKRQIAELPETIIGFERIWNQDKLIEFYSAADVFFNPSLEETFGLVTAEAMACGTPAVVMNSTACPELIVDDSCGQVLDLNSSVESYIAAIRDTLLKQNNIIMNFSNELFVQNYYRLYKESI